MAEGIELVNPGNNNPNFYGTVRTQGSFSSKSLTIDLDTLPSQIQSTYPFVQVDKDGENIFFINVARYESGNIFVNFVVQNKANGQTVITIPFSINLKTDGTVGYTIGNPTAFRQALGL